ncbi:hypothetical protein M378DRAFT_9132 [Amanita muscaria Koide BX008]|uniref:Uncharacterized protein n=1 Tax=Amanita muscaria (strain Koide BX008) TaxID=946122 RepID=A0A0C2X178_AMAMK|nr:hypothetical protein M378DRAFT_9132 [Amanita muscaria Koide BX008]
MSPLFPWQTPISSSIALASLRRLDYASEHSYRCVESTRSETGSLSPRTIQAQTVSRKLPSQLLVDDDDDSSLVRKEKYEDDPSIVPGVGRLFQSQM